MENRLIFKSFSTVRKKQSLLLQGLFLWEVLVPHLLKTFQKMWKTEEKTEFSTLLAQSVMWKTLWKTGKFLKKSKIALQRDLKKDDKNFSTIGQQPISQLFNKLLRKAESQKPLYYKVNLSFPQFPQALLTLLRL